jgi:hypothetical protein
VGGGRDEVATRRERNGQLSSDARWTATSVASIEPEPSTSISANCSLNAAISSAEYIESRFALSFFILTICSLDERRAAERDRSSAAPRSVSAGSVGLGLAPIMRAMKVGLWVSGDGALPVFPEGLSSPVTATCAIAVERSQGSTRVAR